MGYCRVRGCTAPIKARKRYSKHYQRWQKRQKVKEDARTTAPGGITQIAQTKWCSHCSRYRSLSEFYYAKGVRPRIRSNCISCTKKQVSEEYRQRRLKTISEMGGKCVGCGFSDERALQIDHVHGGGTAEFKVLHLGSRAYFEKVLTNPEDYQLLCANCNVIKKIENKEVRRSGTNLVRSNYRTGVTL